VAVSIETINQALATVIDPELRAPITELDMVEIVEVTDVAIKLSLLLTMV
jgi:ATP-binding protein involved in chromosome partitioning